jgi:hypothetical protein
MRFWTISMLVVFATTSYIDCQQASQSNKVSYEGQKVATVELVANPKIPVESLRSLVQQKIDEPYSASRIEDSSAGHARSSSWTALLFPWDCWRANSSAMKGVDTLQRSKPAFWCSKAIGLAGP